MMLVSLLIILMAGGILAWIFASVNKLISSWIALIALLADLLIVVSVWINSGASFAASDGSQWIASVQYSWIPQFAISFHLAMDGISLVMTALTFFLGIIAVLVSWKTINSRTGFYYFNLLWLLAGITGVFLAMDMMLFYFFWEIMLVPMYFVIAIWGHSKAREAGWKFFLFTQISGLMMLLSILALFFIHGNATQDYTFDYFKLLGTIPGGPVSFWLMAGFLLAFFVKLPVVPFHSWLPDAYTEAPLAGSIIIAALMSKTAAYGLIRFVVPLFPEAAKNFALPALIIGAASILYGAQLAYGQKNLKTLVAYSSLSHMGFILIGVFSFNIIAYQGVLMQMVAHGLSIAALFIISEFIYERTATFDLHVVGGFWRKMPNLGGFTIVFVMASVGLPALANFVAEFLILAGAWQFNVIMSVLATLGLIVSVTYSLLFFQKIFHQKNHSESWKLQDINPREWLVMGSLTIAIIWLGFFPQSIIRVANPSFEKINNATPVSEKPVTFIPASKLNKTISVAENKKGGKVW